MALNVTTEKDKKSRRISKAKENSLQNNIYIGVEKYNLAIRMIKITNLFSIVFRVCHLINPSKASGGGEDRREQQGERRREGNRGGGGGRRRGERCKK